MTDNLNKATVQPRPWENENLSEVDRLQEIIRYLRRHPDGCAWTREQTHQSLAPYLVEESFETIDAIDRQQINSELRDELGDVMLQIALHADIADSRGDFDFQDVARAINDKLIRRYPTILGDEPNTLKTAEEIDKRWEEIKAAERARKGKVKEKSILDEVSTNLPALMRSQKLKGRAAREGWEWPNVEMLLDKISEEIVELKSEIDAQKKDQINIMAEFGDLLFMMVDFARWHGFDAEEALRTTNARFEKRFRFMEQKIKDSGFLELNACPVELRRQFWEDAKAEERKDHFGKS